MTVASGAMCRDEAGPLATSPLNMTASMYPFMEPHGLKLAAGSVEQYGQYPGHQHHPPPTPSLPTIPCSPTQQQTPSQVNTAPLTSLYFDIDTTF